MSSVTGYFNEAAAAGQAGYGLYNQIERALHGNKNKVHFVQGNVTVLEFDVTLNETHSFSVMPSSFPVESGAVISDHATVAPIQLSITGLIADYPVETRNQLINSTVTSVITAATTPLGGVGALAGTVGLSAVAGAQRGFISLNAQNKSKSRSAKIFDDLQRLAGYPSEQRPTAAPQAFDVITRLRRYPQMVITSMQLNRDSTTGPTNMVFTLNLQQIQVAYSRTTLLQTAIPAKASPKQINGESESKKSSLELGREQGEKDANLPRSLGNTIRNLLPGTD